MDRATISHIAHTRHPIAAPISDRNVATLLDRLPVPNGGRVVDLGCGRGEWLLRLLAARTDLTAVGVDTSEFALDDARAHARVDGLTARIDWVNADAATWTDDAERDAAICIGASHAFGGLDEALSSIRRHLKPRSHALYGDGFWERPPDAAAQAALDTGPDDRPDLAGLVTSVVARGWEVISAHVSTAEEWDDYEWAWTGSLVEWSLQRKPDDDALQARRAAAEHRDGWLSGYRGQLGFVTFVLADVL